MTEVDFDSLKKAIESDAQSGCNVDSGASSLSQATPDASAEAELGSEDSRVALSQKKLAQKCRVAAMNKLARREHSKKELWLKLNTQKAKLIQNALSDSAGASWEEHSDHVDEQAIEMSLRDKFGDLLSRSLAKLEQEGLLSDERFAEAYLNMRANAGFGPEKIKLELNQRGITSVEWVGEARDWRAALRDVIERKTSGKALRTKNEQASLQRFLTHRGFRAADIGAELRARS